MKTARCFFTLALALALSLPLHAQGDMSGFNIKIPGIKPAKKPASDEWRFTWLPFGLHPNPQADYTILTELTKAGLLLPEPSVDKPVYYIAQSMGQHDGGDGIGFSPKAPFKLIQKQLLSALASNGYLPGDFKNPDKTPTQVLIFTWGLHNRRDMSDSDGVLPGGVRLRGSIDGNGILNGGSIDGDLATVSTDEIGNLLDRAKVVGGQRLADEVARKLRFTGQPHDFARRYTFGGGGLRPDLAALILNDCYYMHVTSYDLEALMNNQRNPLPLLWITRVATPASGLNFSKTLPTMISNSAYYYGRETNGYVHLLKRAYKSGKVEIGEAQVVEFISGTATSRPKTPDAPSPPSATATPFGTPSPAPSNPNSSPRPSSPPSSNSPNNPANAPAKPPPGLAPQLKPAKRPASEEWRFTFLPPSLHPNPQIEYTAITKMTDEGRMLPPVSLDNPVYYIMHSLGQQDSRPIGNIPQVQYAQLQKQLEHALSSNGYLPCNADNPPTQMLLVTWGLHASHRYFLAVQSIEVKASQLYRIKKVLWTTNIMIGEQGVAFKKTMPMMISQGAYYLGRETFGYETFVKRAYRPATVAIGAPTVLEYISGTAKPATTGTTSATP